MSRIIMNTMRLTTARVGMARATRRSTYCFIELGTGSRASPRPCPAGSARGGRSSARSEAGPPGSPRPAGRLLVEPGVEEAHAEAVAVVVLEALHVGRI